MQILEMNGIHGGTLATVIIISDGYCTKKVYYWKPTSSFKSVYIFKQIKTHPQKAQLTVALPRLMSASLWSISTFSTPDSFNLMFSGHCRMLLSSARHRHILICLTNHSLLFLISVRLVNPCCWKAIAPFGKKLSASPPPLLFFPLNGMHISNWRKPSLRRILLVHKGLPTSSPAIPLQGSKNETLYQLFFPWHRRGKPWQKPDDLQTQDSACQKSGSIQSIYCIRGHFHVLFLSHIADIAGILTLGYLYFASFEL